MNFKGKVIEVISGDCVIVKSNNTKEHYRVFINHIKAPRINHKNPELSENYANEAKECLRKEFIGKEVEIKVDFAMFLE